MNVTDPEIVDTYSTGLCHVFAIACHLKHGGDFVVALDLDQEHWCDENGEPMMHVPLHVFARIDGPDGPVLRDVLGDRPFDEEEIKREIASRFDVYEFSVSLEEIDTNSWLLSYIADVDGVAARHLGVEIDEGDLDPEDRPMIGYGDEDLEAAMALPEVLAEPGSRPFSFASPEP